MRFRIRARMADMRIMVRWFDKYVWRFKFGKAGTLSVAAALGLDSISRADTIRKVWNFVMVPETFSILQSGWFHLALVIIGMLLMVKATTQGRVVPVPPTPEQRLESAEARLNSIETRWTNAKVETALPNYATRLLIHAACLQKIALLTLWMDDIAGLIYQAEESHFALSEIVRRYPKSDIARAPFANAWRPQTGQEPNDEATRLGLIWYAHLKKHLEDCSQLSPAFGRVDSGPATQRLMSAYGTGWDASDGTVRDCLGILRDHRDELDNIRTAQAANFADPTLQSVIIS